MLVNLKEIVTPAYAGHYAVGSFNCYSYETFRGCIAAGEETGTAELLAHERLHYSVLSLRQVDYVKEAVKKYIRLFHP